MTSNPINLAEQQWWESDENVMALGQALDDEGFFPTTKDVLYYMQKPWKWTREYAYFLTHKTMEGYEE